MTIKSSGLISLSDINVELGLASNAPISLNDTAVRSLLARASGSISVNDAYGKTKIASSISFIGGIFYDTYNGDPVIGWNLVNIWGLLPTGSASPSPISMAPYGGTLYGLLWFDPTRPYELYAKNITTDIYITLNGNRIFFQYSGLQDGYSTFYSTITNNLFNRPGQSNTISFG